MKYNFKKFEEVNSKHNDVITLTRKSNSIGLPRAFGEMYNIVEYNRASLLYDEKEMVIGIKLLRESDSKNTFKIQKNGEFGSSISIASFIKHHKIDTEKYHGKYKYSRHEDDKFGAMFIIKLK